MSETQIARMMTASEAHVHGMQPKNQSSERNLVEELPKGLRLGFNFQRNLVVDEAILAIRVQNFCRRILRATVSIHSGAKVL